MMPFWLLKLFDLNKTIGVIGCGWLGLPLAISLVEDGYGVHGSTTSKEKCFQLKKEHIVPFQIRLSENSISGNISSFLTNLEMLVINVPPKLRGSRQENFVKKMQLLHQEIQKASISKVIFISSTSVYGDLTGYVTEATVPQPLTASGKQLLEAENIFKNDINLKTTIIRFGGLIGPNRHPVTMLSKKHGLSNGNHPINLIHRNDCIQIIQAVLKHSWWNETLNGVYPDHPIKRLYYKAEAKKRGLQPPDYKLTNTEKGKKVHSKVLLNVKKFKFTTSL